MSKETIFNNSPSFQGGLDLLDASDRHHVIQTFRGLCEGRLARGGAQGGIQAILETILDRVAYFPVRPADMEVFDAVTFHPVTFYCTAFHCLSCRH